jgi:hypothetical protein
MRGQRPLDLALEPEDDTITVVGHEGDLARLTGLEAHGGTCRDIQPHAVGRLAVEGERLVGLEEMVVGADLHRAVARVSYSQRDGAAPDVQFDIAGGGSQFTWDHGGSWGSGGAGSGPAAPTLRRSDCGR